MPNVKPVFAVSLWAELGKLSQPDFQKVRRAMEEISRLPRNELTGAHQEPLFTLEYSVEPDGLLTFERLIWTRADPKPGS